MIVEVADGSICAILGFCWCHERRSTETWLKPWQTWQRWKKVKKKQNSMGGKASDRTCNCSASGATSTSASNSGRLATYMEQKSGHLWNYLGIRYSFLRCIYSYYWCCFAAALLLLLLLSIYQVFLRWWIKDKERGKGGVGNTRWSISVLSTTRMQCICAICLKQLVLICPRLPIYLCCVNHEWTEYTDANHPKRIYVHSALSPFLNVICRRRLPWTLLYSYWFCCDIDRLSFAPVLPMPLPVRHLYDSFPCLKKMEVMSSSLMFHLH